MLKSDRKVVALDRETISPVWYGGFMKAVAEDFQAHGYSDLDKAYVVRSLEFSLFCWDSLGMDRPYINYSYANDAVKDC